jgi:hypothetical protein
MAAIGRNGKAAAPETTTLGPAARQGDDQPADPLAETLALTPRSTHKPYLIKFVAGKTGRTANLKDIYKHIYKSTDKVSLAKARLLIKRTHIFLEGKDAPLRILVDEETARVKLIDR